MALIWNIWVPHKLWITSDSDSLNRVCHTFLSHAEPKAWTCKSHLAPKLWVRAKEKTSACAICSCATTPPVCLQISTSNSVFPLRRRNCITNWTMCLSTFFQLSSVSSCLFSQPVGLIRDCSDAHLSQTGIREGRQFCSFFAYLIPGPGQRFKGIRGWAQNSCVKHAAQGKLLQSRQRCRLCGLIFQQAHAETMLYSQSGKPIKFEEGTPVLQT